MKNLIFFLFFALLGAALFLEFKRLTVKPWPAAHFADIEDHFKYGSIGAEVDGFPYAIWRELPAIFAEDIPEGFATFGFLTEPGHELPIGVSVRRVGVERVGFNCGTCHVSTYRVDGEEHMVLGAPAHMLDLQAYITFLAKATADDRLTADAVIEAAEADGRRPSFLDKVVLRFVVFPRLEAQVAQLRNSLAWMENRPAHGPGRTDAGNFWRERWGLRPGDDLRVGTVDFPAVWNQQTRLDGSFHWDGNNRSLDERNISAALAGGAPEWLLETRSINRISDWLMELPPPAYPAAINAELAAEGHAIYLREGCDSCHDVGGAALGKVTHAALLGTDPERTDLFDEVMVGYFGQVGAKYSWQFSNYRVTEGYANMPLDGIWMRAPYLHNGSVPTMADLLAPAEERPVTFFTGCPEFDTARMGFACEAGFVFDTEDIGNGNGGHLYGTALPEPEKLALIEYLKTL
ncbi:hypothetical protein [Marinovum sp.]|uniref:c-type cytochrome n=1 Tax=Marinovum sp. TaxID=2024839 RepID=UPI003A95A2FF